MYLILYFIKKMQAFAAVCILMRASVHILWTARNLWLWLLKLLQTTNKHKHQIITLIVYLDRGPKSPEFTVSQILHNCNEMEIYLANDHYNLRFRLTKSMTFCITYLRLLLASAWLLIDEVIVSTATNIWGLRLYNQGVH